MIVTRFAPSPTGRLHLGHAFSAVVGHERARSDGGRLLLRIEDLDQTRSRPEYIDGIFEDLRWLGLRWDGEPIVQSKRSGAYAEALERLRKQHLIYACFCTRADIAEAVAAPHGLAANAYPGTCRALPDDPVRRETMPHCWRLDSGKALDLAGLPAWTEMDGRRFVATTDDLDDAVLARKEAPASYHLACVVDDAATDVSLVVRGADLRASTPVQRLLQMLLGVPEPLYLHHPLVVQDNGRRLAKRDKAPTLAAMREGEIDGLRLAGQLARGCIPSGFRLEEA